MGAGGAQVGKETPKRSRGISAHVETHIITVQRVRARKSLRVATGKKSKGLSFLPHFAAQGAQAQAAQGALPGRRALPGTGRTGALGRAPGSPLSLRTVTLPHWGILRECRVQ